MAAAVVLVILVASLAIAGCGSTTTTISNAAATSPRAVSVVVTSPTSGSVISADSVVVRGTVDPPSATVQVQGRAAAVGNGIFSATANLHGGRTTIDVIGSSPGAAPGSNAVSVTKQAHEGATGPPSSSAAGPSVTQPTPSVAYERPSEASASQTPCKAGLAVGPDTTCAFAENVRSTFETNGPGSYDVYSPVTERTYTMTCSAGAPVVCTGGNHASVYFP
jgi:hypothetical protein